MKVLKPFLFLIIALLILIGLSILDFHIIPGFLPHADDFCYYHQHRVPLWIDLFYLDDSGHVAPPFTFLHLSLFLVIAGTTSVLATRKLVKGLFK